jgi:hypothetical protein
MSNAGKGDKRRPMEISQKDFDNRWDKIFNKSKEKSKNKKPRK